MRWRPATIVILVLFGAVVVGWSLSDFDDHVPLVIPPELADQADAASVRFTCGAPFGSSSVSPSEAAAENDFALERPPCERTRNEHRLLAGVDLAVVALGVLILTFVGGRSARPATDEPQPGRSSSEPEVSPRSS